MLTPDAHHLRPVLLHAGLARHHADWNWRGVRSPFLRFYYVVSGTAQVRLPQTVLNLRPGRLYLVPAFTTHDYVCTAEFSHYYLHIYDELHDGTSLMSRLSQPLEAKPFDTDLEAVRRLCHLNPDIALPASNPDSYDNHAALLRNLAVSRQRPLPVAVETRALLCVLLSRFLADDAPAGSENIDKRLQRAIDYVHRHLAHPIALSDLAAEACMSRDHFIRLFRRQMGSTPTRFVTRLRMERAERLLASTDQPIKQIAHGLGYDDTSYFIRVFHAHVGQTPQQYRSAGAQ